MVKAKRKSVTTKRKRRPEMTPARVGAELRRVLDEIAAKVTPLTIKIQAEALGLIVETYALQLEYERRRQYEGIDPIDFFEGSKALTGADAKEIREAQELHAQIMARLEGN